MVGSIWSQVLEEDEGRTVFIKVSCGGAQTSLDVWLGKQKEEEESLSPLFVSTVSFPWWKISCVVCPLVLVEDETRMARSLRAAV